MTSMIIGDIIDALERLAPLSHQESYDNSGIQVGLTKAETAGVLFCLDVTEAVIDEAIDEGFNLIVSHHPLIFSPVKKITDATYVGRCVMKAIRNGITIYSAHTCLDNAPRGVNAAIATKIGLEWTEVLRPMEGVLMKLVTFVPTANADALRAALSETGCGNIGNYDSCSFSNEGIGTFRAKAGANPYVGAIDKLHREPETRLEMVFPAHLKSAVIATLLSEHPYEMPAYDIYPVDPSGINVGSGMVGYLLTPLRAMELMQRLKEIFGVHTLAYSGDATRVVRKVALCGGAGAFLIGDALRAKADMFITGEIKYHDFCGNEDKIVLVELGHYESEQFTQHLLQYYLRDLFPSLRMKLSERASNLKQYI